MMKTHVGKAAVFLMLLLLLCPLSFSGSAEYFSWICLLCGAENQDSVCHTCGKIQGVWRCESCGTENLSESCHSCGLSLSESLKTQAAGKNALSAFPAVRFLARQGDVDALLALGTYYEKGLMLPQDYDLALACYQQAADQDYAPAWIRLGNVYDQGILVNRDYFTAMKMYQNAADLGSAEALWYLGTFYEEGFTVRRNYETALSYYRQAAEQGYADSWMSIAYCCAMGHGMERDTALALEYYEKAAEAGSNLACDYLGYQYMTGSDLISPDPGKGMDYYRKAAALGNSRSMVALGYAYQTGQGVEIDLAEAARWYEQAAIAGRTDAAQALASLK